MPAPIFKTDQVGVRLPTERITNRLFWREDMENYTTVKWEPYTVNDTGTYSNNVIRAFEGDYVLGVSNAVQTDTNMFARFGALSQGVHAAEVRWWKYWDKDIQSIQLYNMDPILDTVRAGAILHREDGDRQDGEPGWQYVDINGDRQDIPGGIERIWNNSWNYMRLVLDFENNIYRRMQSNNLNIDLTDLDLPLRYIPSPAGWGIGTFWLMLGGYTTAIGGNLYFDDCRLYLDVE